jgi:hypothetical protein
MNDRSYGETYAAGPPPRKVNERRPVIRAMVKVVKATLLRDQLDRARRGNEGRPLHWPALVWSLELECNHEQQRAVPRIFGMERHAILLPPIRVHCSVCEKIRKGSAR